EKQAIATKAQKFGDHCQSGRTMEYWQGYGGGGSTGYHVGYTACAEQSVPLSEYAVVVNLLKGAVAALQNSRIRPDVYANNPEYLAAQEVITKAKQYINE